MRLSYVTVKPYGSSGGVWSLSALKEYNVSEYPEINYGTHDKPSNRGCLMYGYKSLRRTEVAKLEVCCGIVQPESVFCSFFQMNWHLVLCCLNVPSLLFSHY